jgi:hypothetical protein
MVDAATLAAELGVARSFVYEHADTLGVARSFVYEHADTLGVVKLGNGSRPRLRFDVDRAREALAGLPAGSAGRRSAVGESPANRPETSMRRRRPSGTSADLLPIRGARTI